MAKPFVAVLVSGHEYLRHGIDWAKPSLSRERFLARKSALRPLYVMTIDVSRGSVREAKFGLKTEANKPETKEHKLKEPYTDKNYELVELKPDRYTYVFNKGFSKVLSVLDVYKAALSTADSQGPIIEFSIFSHAEFSGPVLANTFAYQRVEKRGSQYVLVPAPVPEGDYRDPDDLDPRKIDFTDKNQAATNIERWKKAFARGGYSRLWGCQRWDAILTLMRRVKEGTPRVSSSTSDDATIKLHLRDYEYSVISGLYSELVHKAKQSNVYEMKFGLFKALMNVVLSNTYAQKLADISGAPVYAAAPGTYADFLRNGQDMYVHESTSDIVPSYESWLKMKPDPESHGYIGYTPSDHT